MKKTLTGIFAAAMAATAMLAPMSANAFSIDGDTDDFSKATNGYTEVYGIDFFDWTLHGSDKSEDYRVFVNEDGTHFRTFDRINGAHDVYITLAEDVSKEDVENALYEKYSENYEKVQFWLESYRREPVQSYYIMRNCTHSSITKQEAVEYLEFLKEQQLISSGKLLTNVYQVKDILSSSSDRGLMAYQIVNGDADLYGTLCDYVEKELVGYKVETTYLNKDYRWVELVSHDGKTLDDICLEEKLEISRNIYEATHLEPDFYWWQSGATVGGECGIDVVNALKGDANCDGKVTLADSVAILQNIGNKDKYPLTSQGKFNGDVTGGYDGLTAADAYELQVVDSQK